MLPVSQSLTMAEVAPGRHGFAMGFMQNFGSNVLGSTAASLILVALAERSLPRSRAPPQTSGGCKPRCE